MKENIIAMGRTTPYWIDKHADQYLHHT